MVCRIEEYAKIIHVVRISQCRLHPFSLFDGPYGVIIPASALVSLVPSDASIATLSGARIHVPRVAITDIQIMVRPMP